MLANDLQAILGHAQWLAWQLSHGSRHTRQPQRIPTKFRIPTNGLPLVIRGSSMPLREPMRQCLPKGAYIVFRRYSPYSASLAPSSAGLGKTDWQVGFLVCPSVMSREDMHACWMQLRAVSTPDARVHEGVTMQLARLCFFPHPDPMMGLAVTQTNAVTRNSLSVVFRDTEFPRPNEDVLQVAFLDVDDPAYGSFYLHSKDATTVVITPDGVHIGDHRLVIHSDQAVAAIAEALCSLPLRMWNACVSVCLCALVARSNQSATVLGLLVVVCSTFRW